MHSVDILIVGGGIAGAIAWFVFGSIAIAIGLIVAAAIHG